jgi:hypothetical protein
MPTASADQWLRITGDIWTYQVYGQDEEVPPTSIDLRLSMESIYENLDDLEAEPEA